MIAQVEPAGMGTYNRSGVKRATSPIYLQYLFEIKRITVEPTIIFDSLTESIGLEKCRASFARVIAEAMRISWTRDPFDRIITATAMIHQAGLLTKDKVIRREYGGAVWD